MSSPPRSEFRLRRRVHFYEVDGAGLVHFSWFFRYMEEAEHAMWREAGISVMPAGAEVGFPRVSASFEFYKPLRFEDEFEVWIRIAALGEKSIRYVCELSRDHVRIAAGAITVACVRTVPGQPMKAVPIPAEIAAKFQVAADAPA